MSASLSAAAAAAVVDGNEAKNFLRHSPQHNKKLLFHVFVSEIRQHTVHCEKTELLPNILQYQQVRVTTAVDRLMVISTAPHSAHKLLNCIFLAEHAIVAHALKQMPF